MDGDVRENSWKSIFTVPGGRYLVGSSNTFWANAVSIYLRNGQDSYSHKLINKY